MFPATLSLLVGTNVFSFVPADNPSATVFIERMPVTLQMSRLNKNFAQAAWLEPELAPSPVWTDQAEAGDVFLQHSSLLDIALRPLSLQYETTRLGRIGDPERLAELIRDDVLDCTFRIEPSATTGVFANGQELSKDPDWPGLSDPCVRYDEGDDTFVVVAPNWNSLGLPQVTLTGTNISGDVAIRIEGESFVEIKDLYLRTTATNQAPIRIDDDARATLFLAGANRLVAAPGAAGVELGDCSRLVITNAPMRENAKLFVIGGERGAGIGTGTEDVSVSLLAIRGGVIEACGGSDFAAGVGQGDRGRIEEFRVEGGTVRARGGVLSQDFLSGYSQNHGHQFITGGSFDVETFGGTPFGANYKQVRHITIRNSEWTIGEPVAVSIVSSDETFSYGTNGIFVGTDRSVHVWLPEGNHTVTVFDLDASAEILPDTISLLFDFSAEDFEPWCILRGLEPRGDAMTDGEPNILRFLFAKSKGPIPMPVLDATSPMPTARMPSLKHEYPQSTIIVIGTTNLTLPNDQWDKLYPDWDDPTLWRWDGTDNPRSFFIRYRVEFY